MGQSASIHPLKDIEAEITFLTARLKRLEDSTYEIDRLINESRVKLKSLTVFVYDLNLQLQELIDKKS